MLKSKLEPYLNEIAEKYKSGASTEALAREYGVMGSIIRKFLRRMNITLRDSKLESKEQEIIDLYKSGIPSTKLAIQFNVSKPTILSLLRSHKIERRSLSEACRIYSINENIFDLIDTEEKAYFLGLLYTDGNNFPETHLISFGLKKEDKYMVQRFKELLQSDAPLTYIKSQDNFCKLAVANKYLSKQLEKLGIVKCKTFKITFPEWLDANLIQHFIRGVFDGDGCITELEFSITGTEELLLHIQEILMVECELLKTKLDNRFPERNNNIRSLRYSGREQIIKIMEYMYKDSSIFLQRKHDIFMRLKNDDVQYKKIYDEKHCWQYDVRIKNYKNDLYTLDFTNEKVEALTTNDFYFEAIVKPTKEQYSEIKTFIQKYEWLGRMPNRPSHFFISRLKENNVLAGIVIMSFPNMFSHLLGKENKDLERLISRGACASWTPKNLGSHLVMQSIHWMTKNTKYRMFSAYADPEAQEIGTIYQACNFIYLGRNYRKKAELFFDPKNPQKGWFNERHFTHKVAYIRYLRNLNLYKEFLANPDWFINYTLNWSKIPQNIIDKIKQEIIHYKSSCIKRVTESKHKYVYILGSTKKETKFYKELFFDRNSKLIRLVYPKRGEK